MKYTLAIILIVLVFSCSKNNYKADFEVYENKWKLIDGDSISSVVFYSAKADLKDSLLVWSKIIQLSENGTDTFVWKIKTDRFYQIDSVLNWEEVSAKYNKFVKEYLHQLPNGGQVDDWIKSIIFNKNLIIEKNTKDCSLFLNAYSFWGNVENLSDWTVVSQEGNITHLRYRKQVPEELLDQYIEPYSNYIALNDSTITSFIDLEFMVNRKLREIIWIKDTREVFIGSDMIGGIEMYIRNKKPMSLLYEVKE